MKVMERVLFSAIAIASLSAMSFAQAPGGGRGGPGGPGGGRGPARPVFSVTTEAWPDGGEVPAKFSFRGENKLPAFEFHWTLASMTPAPSCQLPRRHSPPTFPA